MICFEHVSRTFDGEVALDDFSLHFPKNRLFGVMGPGGSGKSTLCRMACGLVRPDAGTVTLDGTDLYAADRKTRASIQARCGVQFQNDALFEHMTVIANIAYPLQRLTTLRRGEALGRAMERLAIVGLAGLEERLPSQLSGGQRRRVALARACVTSPDVLICDDPTAGLDPVTSRRILDMISGIRYQERNTVIVISTDINGLLSVADRLALVWDGRLIAEGSPAEFEAHGEFKVKRFLDDARLPAGAERWR